MHIIKPWAQDNSSPYHHHHQHHNPLSIRLLINSGFCQMDSWSTSDLIRHTYLCQSSTHIKLYTLFVRHKDPAVSTIATFSQKGMRFCALRPTPHYYSQRRDGFHSLCAFQIPWRSRNWRRGIGGTGRMTGRIRMDTEEEENRRITKWSRKTGREREKVIG